MHDPAHKGSKMVVKRWAQEPTDKEDGSQVGYYSCECLLRGSGIRGMACGLWVIAAGVGYGSEVRSLVWQNGTVNVPSVNVLVSQNTTVNVPSQKGAIFKSAQKLRNTCSGACSPGDLTPNRRSISAHETPHWRGS